MTAPAPKAIRLAACFAALTAALATSATGCNKDVSKKANDAPKAPTPAPSDIVLNDFLAGQGASSGVAVRVDGGAEAGSVAGGSSGDGPALAVGGAASTEGEIARPKVTDPGAEPRAPRRYTFTPSKVDKRLVVVRQSTSEGGKSQDHPALAMTIQLTPKTVKPQATSFEMRMLNIDLADKEKLDNALAPQIAQVTQQLSAMNGMTATFDVDPHGTVGEAQLKPAGKFDRAAEEMIGIFQQAVEVMLPPLPDAPIGVGAKWERSVDAKQMGLEIKGRHVFVLKELTAEGGVIAATIEQKIPKRAIPDPRARGATVEAVAKGSYVYEFRFDRVATKVEGELNRRETIEIPAEGGKKETIVRNTKVVHTMTMM